MNTNFISQQTDTNSLETTIYRIIHVRSTNVQFSRHLEYEPSLVSSFSQYEVDTWCNNHTVVWEHSRAKIVGNLMKSKEQSSFCE